MPKFSITFISKNEEKNLERALISIQGLTDDIILADSFSTDKTLEVAQKFHVKTFSQTFLGYGEQKNFAAQKAQYDWILNLDCDEELSDELKAFLQKFKEEKSEEGQVIKINRRTNFCGKWIYHGGWYPDYVSRLYDKTKVKWNNPPVHEKLISNDHMKEKSIPYHLNHYSFPTCKSQIDTNVRFAFLGAQALIKKPSLLTLFFKPPFKFFECYVLKKGFLDGLSGFIIAVNASYSLFMKYSIRYLDLNK